MWTVATVGGSGLELVKVQKLGPSFNSGLRKRIEFAGAFEPLSLSCEPSAATCTITWAATRQDIELQKQRVANGGNKLTKDSN